MTAALTVAVWALGILVVAIAVGIFVGRMIVVGRGPTPPTPPEEEL